MHQTIKKVHYQDDVVAWAFQQAKMIRLKKWDFVDLEQIAEEIEDVGKSEQRELESRMAVLITHLLKWLFQPSARSQSWAGSIREQRKRIHLAIKRTPSLKNSLTDEYWLSSAWADGLIKAISETNLDTFPEIPIWTSEEMLQEGWFPENLPKELVKAATNREMLRKG